MSEGLKLPKQPEDNTPKSGFKADLPGKITAVIGSGHHAQASIVWQTIKWCFITGSGLTLVVLFWAWLDDAATFQVSSIESIWSLFIPLITSNKLIFNFADICL